jgi:hypothetical protein
MEKKKYYLPTSSVIVVEPLGILMNSVDPPDEHIKPGWAPKRNDVF